MEYPLFIPPKELWGKQTIDWNYDEAKVYFKWFIEIKEDRVNNFLNIINEKRTSNHQNDLKRIGKKVSELIQSSPFSRIENEKKILTNEGAAIAADISLLLSEYILNKHPELKWGIVRKPKRDISVNLPAIMPFPRYGHLELMKDSIVSCRNILQYKENSIVWLETYNDVNFRLEKK
ncbi:hypothetical protein [Sphingobacterium endophyticum]|uniref:hypothetical protein n=1 Tax=Sphingobacterium endophyticum TaxID=2546448 RepID=UPI0012E29E22|nr:hypothetical protein [Sphingobacterium endophyticum]